LLLQQQQLLLLPVHAAAARFSAHAQQTLPWTLALTDQQQRAAFGLFAILATGDGLRCWWQQYFP
jgi:hypothetical protein